MHTRYTRAVLASVVVLAVAISCSGTQSQGVRQESSQQWWEREPTSQPTAIDMPDVRAIVQHSQKMALLLYAESGLAGRNSVLGLKDVEPQIREIEADYYVLALAYAPTRGPEERQALRKAGAEVWSLLVLMRAYREGLETANPRQSFDAVRQLRNKQATWDWWRIERFGK